MSYNQTGDISTLEGTPLKLVDKFTYLGSNVESTEKDIETRLTKAWTAINRLSIIWKSDLTDKMKHSFFQAAVASILLYECTTWTLTKRLEKKLDGNYTRMLRAILNKSWRQHPTRHQLYGHLPPITKTIQVRRTRHAGHCWRSRAELIRDVLLWTPTHDRAKAGRPFNVFFLFFLVCVSSLCAFSRFCAFAFLFYEHTFSSYVRIRDVVLKTYLGQWTIGRSGERGSGISVLPARDDDDDDDAINNFCDWFICNFRGVLKGIIEMFFPHRYSLILLGWHLLILLSRCSPFYSLYLLSTMLFVIFYLQQRFLFYWYNL